MILSLQLEEDYIYGSLFIFFDFLNKKLIHMKNNHILKEETLNIDINTFREVLNSYIMNWDNSYVDNGLIDGKKAILKIYTDDEIIEYKFKNKFPSNYNDFIQFMKEGLGIYE